VHINPLLSIVHVTNNEPEPPIINRAIQIENDSEDINFNDHNLKLKSFKFALTIP